MIPFFSDAVGCDFFILFASKILKSCFVTLFPLNSPRNFSVHYIPYLGGRDGSTGDSTVRGTKMTIIRHSVGPKKKKKMSPSPQVTNQIAQRAYLNFNRWRQVFEVPVFRIATCHHTSSRLDVFYQQNVQLMGWCPYSQKNSKP